MMRRSGVVWFMVMMSRFTIVQAALMLISIFFGLFFQDFLRPYESLTADHVEFGSLFILHFILLLGILFHSVQLEQLRWNEGTCLEVMNDISMAENLSTVVDDWDDIAVVCAQAELSYEAANATYNFIVVSLKWFPVLFLCLAVWASYSDLYKALQAHLRKNDEDDEDNDPKLAKLNELCKSVLAPSVLAGTRDFLRDSTPTEREYFKHLLILLEENYNGWLDRQAKTTLEFLKSTTHRLIQNLQQLYRIMVACGYIIFCLRDRKRTHVEEDPHAPGGANEVSASSDAAAVALPPKGAKKKAFIAKVLALAKARLGVGTEEEAKPPKQRPKGRDPNAPSKAGEVDAPGDDLVEAYIRFVKSKHAAEGCDAPDRGRGDGSSESLAFPELSVRT